MKIKYSDIIKNQPTTNLGMIGHVASGKSTLAYQITGVKTQKFASEKERNITIHIGYANAKIFLDKKGNFHTTSSDTNNLLDDEGEEMKLIKHISIVDCPGHESFMSNMINGSAVMDACVLVIATNEVIPQPQTYEHLQAVESIDIDKYIIVQNKMDLINKKDNPNKLEDINNFLKNTSANNNDIIPTSVQSGRNVKEIINSIVNLPLFERDINKPACLTVIRSFDINKPNISYNKLNGGIIGGSLTQGFLKKNDIVELRPGFIMKQKDGSIKYRPILSKVETLQSDQRQLENAFPGGLIGVKLDIDPSLTKNNGMVGQLMGHIGTLPPVYMAIELKFNYINRYDKISKKFKKKEKIIICANAMRIKSDVYSIRKKKNTIKLVLEKPICLHKDQKIALFKNIDSKWKLLASSNFIDGVECEMHNFDDELYNKLKKKMVKEEIEIDYDIPKVESKSQNYENLLNNITFRDNINFTLQVKPPIIKYIYPVSTLVNFNDICVSVNLTPKEKEQVDYKKLLHKYFISELSCDAQLNGSNQLCLRGKFQKKNVEGVLVNFINHYLKCFSCKSPRSFLSKNNKKLYKNCLTCLSVSCVS